MDRLDRPARKTQMCRCLCVRNAYVLFWAELSKELPNLKILPRTEDQAFVLILEENLVTQRLITLKKVSKERREKKIHIFITFCWMFRIINKRFYQGDNFSEDKE